MKREQVECSANHAENDAKSELELLRAVMAGLRAALQEIALGRGPFNRDPLKHAENTIEAMKECARNALAGIPQQGQAE